MTGRSPGRDGDRAAASLPAAASPVAGHPGNAAPPRPPGRNPRRPILQDEVRP